MSSSAKQTPQSKILDAAEQAFAEFGFAGASLRQIVADAGVNLATVYYYFGSKRGLMAAVFSRRFGPLAQAQLESLKRFQQQTPGQPVLVEKILEALILPALRLTTAASPESMAVTRIIGRIVTEPTPQTQELLKAQYLGVRVAVFEAIQAALPGTPSLDLHWRLEFFWGALAFILCNAGNLKEKTNGLCDPANTQQVLAQMTRSFTAGFHAPPVA